MLVGTVNYLPPEQALGRSSDERSDVYSLGAMLYELLTGEPPFPGEDAVAIIGQHLNALPVAPSLPPSRDLARDRPARPAICWRSRRMTGRRPPPRPGARSRPPPAPPPRSRRPSPRTRSPSLAGGVFVGRDAELDEMRTSLEDALGGQGRLLLLSGDPGIGKTRTAEQLATYARVRGARVYWGRCQESEGQPPYWPWSEALRSYVLDADPVGLRWQLGSRAADVAAIVPELADRLGDLGEPSDMETEQARFRLFDSFAGFLAGASSDRPMVIVLDDLHWADEPSLLLLRFVARRLADTGLLLIGTYRDVELGRHHPLADTLGDLAGVEGARRVTLTGLDSTGIADYIELTAGVDRPPADLAEAIRDQTGGNPFFIGEVVRLMAAEGRLGEGDARRQVAIPQGVREVVGRRLDRLSDDANEVLRIAAVYGRDFRLDVLDRVCGLATAEIEAALREAVGDRLVNEPAAGLYSFSHALVRETLQAEVAASKRVAMHLEIAEALEQVYAGELDRHLGELAHHFIEAAPLGEVDRAVDYATRAAATASRAARLRGRGRPLREGARGARARAPNRTAIAASALLLDLGTAQTRASRLSDARATLDHAAQLARELGRTEQMAQAVLGMTLLSVAGVVNDHVIELLNESLEAVGEQDSPLRSQLISGLAQELYWTDPAGRSDDLGLEALEMARRLGDSKSLAFALVRRQFTGAVGPAETRRRLDESNEMHDLAKRVGDRELELRAHVYRLRNRLELGEMHEVDADLAAFERLANELRQPTHLWHVPGLKAMRALIDGRFDDAERLIAEAFEAGTRAEEPVSEQFHGTQIALLRRLRRSQPDVAELGNLVAGLADLADRFPAIPAWRCSLAATHAELGHENETRAVFETLAADDFADLPLDSQWAISLCLLAEAAVFLDDVPRARLLYDHLLPYDGLNVIAGRAAASYGPVARVLGLLAVTAGRLDDAERHFTEALAMSERMGDRPFSAQARVEPGQDAARARRRLRSPASARPARPGARVGAGDRHAPVAQRGAHGAARGPGPGVARRDDLDRLHDRRGRLRAAGHRRPRGARRPGDDPVLRHRELDPDDRASRRPALARAPARPQRGLPPPGVGARRVRGQEPGRRVHARLPRLAPRGRVRC